MFLYFDNDHKIHGKYITNLDHMDRNIQEFIDEQRKNYKLFAAEPTSRCEILNLYNNVDDIVSLIKSSINDILTLISNNIKAYDVSVYSGLLHMNLVSFLQINKRKF